MCGLEHVFDIRVCVSVLHISQLSAAAGKARQGKASRRMGRAAALAQWQLAFLCLLEHALECVDGDDDPAAEGNGGQAALAEVVAPHDALRAVAREQHRRACSAAHLMETSHHITSHHITSHHTRRHIFKDIFKTHNQEEYERNREKDARSGERGGKSRARGRENAIIVLFVPRGGGGG